MLRIFFKFFLISLLMIHTIEAVSKTSQSAKKLRRSGVTSNRLTAGNGKKIKKGKRIEQK